MKAIRILFLSVCSLFFSCSGNEEPEKHPVVGKWHLSYVDDSSVIDNPHIIGMEFREDGTIRQVDGGVSYEAKYIISDDTTSISVIEGGKPVTEFKLRLLTRERMEMEEGFHVVTFLKVK